MKALSIKEPWASLIRLGKKTIETRVWFTHYRGPILLCASKIPLSEISGHAFATAELIDSRAMTPEDEEAACCKIYPNAVAWVLKDIMPIEPFPVKGQLGLFEIKYEGGNKWGKE